MKTDRIVLRPRGQAEAMDLGFHLARANWPALAGQCLLILLPVAAAAALAFLWHPPLALLALWWLKPLLDRPLLDLLGRDLTGAPTGIRDTWARRRQWLRGGLIATLTVFRLHPARSAALPVWQLERLTGADRRRRAKALAHGSGGSGAGLTLMALMFEAALLAALIALLVWLVPANGWDEFRFFATLEWGVVPDRFWAGLAVCYAAVLVLSEPFYVAGGFGLYLNQRCRLECWDLEPVLRNLAARHAVGRAA